MVSLEHNFSMLPRQGESDNFAMYPDPPQGVFSSAPMDMSVPAEAFTGFARPAQDMFPTSMGFDAAPLYAEASNYMFANQASPGLYPEDGEMRVPSSNLSTASAPSATSSAVGSPESHHGQLAPVAEWAPGLAGTPSIVPNDYYHPTGTEYSTFTATGMEEFAFDFTNSKHPSFVGELPHVPRSSLLQRSAGSFSSSISQESKHSSASTVTPDSGLVLDTQLLTSPVSSAPSRRSSLSFVSPSSTCLSSPPAPQWSPSPKTPRVPHFFSQSSGHFVPPLGSSYPTLIHPDVNRAMPMPGFEATFQHPSAYPASPSLSSSPQPMMRNGSQSPFLLNGYQQQYSPFQPPVDMSARRPSIHSFPSTYSEANNFSGDESKEKQRCPHPECGKTFKDLKAHMLTHQNERPEKCPIQTCDYHVKGFARKYDKNRHTLTHYKGTMVCGFCPGSGSAAEKSFNRADVFKRHLTAVHGVEQTPPNSRKKTSSGVSSGKKLAGYPPDATGKCSTCSQTFSNAQDFYEHLDDCVLRIVQQEDPAEAINAQRLAEVENDKDVHQTLEKNHLPTQTQTTSTEEDDDEDDMMDDDDVADEDFGGRKLGSPSKKKGNPANGVQKSRGVTHSRGGVPLQAKNRGRKNRRDYPSSWGFDKGQMTMKKRVMAVFEGPRRLAKDDMMLSTEHEVRVKLSDGKSYVTDLDVQTLKRAEGFLGATDEEKGPWISDDPTEEELQLMQQMIDCRKGGA